ncbi:HNH endonuclease [Streptomyces tsukubensis]|uniref:HNH endonuclease n=1 Tax=Streptomyces tsukubensis TaxID=83656 RepID=UPI0036CB70A5
MTWSPPTSGWDSTTASAYRGVWGRLRSLAWRRDAGLCQHLRYDTGLPCLAAGAAVDHIVPVSAGGIARLDNAQVLCHHHHTAKTAREAAVGRRRARAARDLPNRGKRVPGGLDQVQR